MILFWGISIPHGLLKLTWKKPKIYIFFKVFFHAKTHPNARNEDTELTSCVVHHHQLTPLEQIETDATLTNALGLQLFNIKQTTFLNFPESVF